jgi:hypothetical protein
VHPVPVCLPPFSHLSLRSQRSASCLVATHHAPAAFPPTKETCCAHRAARRTISLRTAASPSHHISSQQYSTINPSIHPRTPSRLLACIARTSPARLVPPPWTPLKRTPSPYNSAGPAPPRPRPRTPCPRRAPWPLPTDAPRRAAAEARATRRAGPGFSPIRVTTEMTRIRLIR